MKKALILFIFVMGLFIFSSESFANSVSDRVNISKGYTRSIITGLYKEEVGRKSKLKKVRKARRKKKFKKRRSWSKKRAKKRAKKNK